MAKEAHRRDGGPLLDAGCCVRPYMHLSRNSGIINPGGVA